MKKWLATLLFCLILPTVLDARGGIIVAPTVGALRQQNLFGLTGADWQSPGTYYSPGHGNPAVSTSDYYHINGMYWFRPYDLTASACGSAGAALAAKYGRYYWVVSPDHYDGHATWTGGDDFRAGFSNDPGVPPSFMFPIYVAGTLSNNPLIATISGTISGTTLTVTSVASGTISFDSNATIGGNATPGTQITGFLSGTQGGVGTYSVNNSQTTTLTNAPVNWSQLSVYQVPMFVCNPDDVTNPFYIYAEAFASRVEFAEAYLTSPDLTNWTLQHPSHVTWTFGSQGSWSAYQVVVRDGVNTWHSFGLEAYYSASNIFGNGNWTSTDGQYFAPALSNTNVCIPPNTTGPTGATPCPDSPAFQMGIGSQDPIVISAQAYLAVRKDSTLSQVRVGPQWVSRVPIDSSYNVLSSPATVNISPAYAGQYPGPNYLQNVSSYTEDGIVHYYAQIGFFPASSQEALVEYAPLLNGGVCDLSINNNFTLVGSISGTTLTVTSTTHTIAAGMQLTYGVNNQAIITAQTSGPTGGTGTYTITVSQTVSSTTITVSTCGGLSEEGIDYYTEIIDPVAAASAAPIGVVASCNSGTVTISWYNALPNNTYRVYRGTTASSQTTLVGNVTGTSITDTPTAGSTYYYKVVTIKSGTEEKSRVVHTYASSAATFVNQHVTRALDAGADPLTINVPWITAFNNWLVSNGLSNNLQFATMAEFGVVRNGSDSIAKIMDLGTTRLPRGGDYTPTSLSTVYTATGFNGAPGWINGSSDGYGFYGNGLLNNIRRKTQITVYSLFQNIDQYGTDQISTGEFNGMALYYTVGPSTANFSLSDATQTLTATASTGGAIQGTVHSIAGTFDGTTLAAWADGSIGTGTQTGLVIPTGNLGPVGPDALTGQIDAPMVNTKFLAVGSDASKYQYNSDGTGNYQFDHDGANYIGGAQIIFDIALTTGQMASLDSLLKAHFAPALTCDITTGNCTGTGGGTSLFTAATCNGSTDDSPSFTSFNSFAQTWQGSNTGRIVLNIPSSKSCYVNGNTVVCPTTALPQCPFTGIKNLAVVGATSSTLKIGSGVVISLGGMGLYGDNAHSARTVSANKGDTCVSLITSAQSSLFSAGNPVVMTGFDLQSTWQTPFGFPPNPQYWNFLHVASVDGSHQCDGVTSGASVHFTTALTFQYLSTWPNYNSGGSGQIDPGGPATLYVLDNSYDSYVEFDNLTIDSANSFGANSNSVTFNGVTMPTSCANPSQNVLFAVINSDLHNCGQVEVDKLIDTMMTNGSSFHEIFIQSADPKVFSDYGSTMFSIEGTPQTFVGFVTTITSVIKPGAVAYGRSNAFNCLSCSIASLDPGGGAADSGLGHGVQNTYTMSSGTIRIPNGSRFTSAINNSGAAELVVTSSAGWTTGEYVNVEGGNGTYAGVWQVTVNDGTHITLSGSTFSVTDTGYVISANQSAVPWAAPGTNIMFTSAHGTEAIGQVTSVTQDATFTYVNTTFAGGFPSDVTGIQAHPAPIFNCAFCSGADPQISSLSHAPANAPIFSYQTYTYPGTIGTTAQPFVNLWGTLTSLDINVTVASSGAAPFQFAGFDNTYSGGSVMSYGPLVASNTTGDRHVNQAGTVTCNGTAGTCAGGDSLTTPANLWYSNVSQAQFTSAPSASTSVTVTVQTNQGVVNP